MVLAIHRFPLTDSDIGDFKSAISHHVLPDYAPAAPFLRRDVSVLAAGSCFAENVTTALANSGVRATVLRVEEANNTPFATHSLIAKIVNNTTGHGEHLPVLRDASLFILTVGVALQRFHDGAPQYFGSETITKGHTWRMLTVEEIHGYIRSIISSVRSANPTAHIVLTLSPIPLKASIQHGSVFGQDCLSKSLLRVAVDAVMREQIPSITYWPSFEIIRWLAGHFGPFFGVEGAEDHRHVAPDVLNTIMEMFVERYFIA